MDYNALLDKAYETVNRTKDCDRFEIKKINVIYEGTKTIITDFMQLTACLRRDPAHVARFLYKNLASYGEIVGDRLIFGRKIMQPMIEKKIQLYVDEYVSCPKCGKPDSEIVDEEGKNYLKCLACGAKVDVNKI
jgi:translation initiation factor 2 subunit 2